MRPTEQMNYLKKSDDIYTWEIVGWKGCFVEHYQENCKMEDKVWS